MFSSNPDHPTDSRQTTTDGQTQTETARTTGITKSIPPNPASGTVNPTVGTHKLNADINYVIKTEIEHYEHIVNIIDDRVSTNEKSISIISEALKHREEVYTANVPTYNPFDVLSAEDSQEGVDTPVIISDSPTKNNSPPRRQSASPPKRHPSRPSPVTSKPPIKVKIVGSSLAKDMAFYVEDDSMGVHSCSVPYGGFKAQHISRCLSGAVSETDDLLVIFGGTNNIPGDSVAECIRNIDTLVGEAVRLRPSRPILLSQIPARFDGDYREKIKQVNAYIDYLCDKYSNLHILCHKLTRKDLNGGGLHFSKLGKTKIGGRIRRIATKIC